MAAKIVVDSSLIIKWFKSRNEDLLEEARALLDEIERQPLEVHAPALLLYEVGNILLLKTQLGPAALDDAIARLDALPFSVPPPATPSSQARCPSWAPPGPHLLRRVIPGAGREA